MWASASSECFSGRQHYAQAVKRTFEIFRLSTTQPHVIAAPVTTLCTATTVQTRRPQRRIRRCCGPSRVGLRFSGIGSIVVRHTLINVARHIIQTQFIGFFSGNGVSFTTRIATVPSNLVEVISTRVIISTAQIASTGGKFPLSLSGYAERHARHCIQLGYKLHLVGPCYILHREISTLGITWVGAHHSGPQGLSHLSLAHIEAGERHLMRRIMKG